MAGTEEASSVKRRRIFSPPQNGNQERTNQDQLDGGSGPDTKTDNRNMISTISSPGRELLNFLLKQLRISNVFFLVIISLDLFGYNPTGDKWSTVLPLGIVILSQFVFTVHAWVVDRIKIKDIHDMCDFKVRSFTNNKGTAEFRAAKTLGKLQPGDMVCLETKGKNKAYVPADLVLLSVACSCHKHKKTTCGRCSVLFSNLTGEKGSRDRQAPERTAYWSSPEELSVNIEILVPDTPTEQLEDFSGDLKFNTESIKLSGINFLPRGSHIFNAEIVYGIVVYTGRDTKMARYLNKPGWRGRRSPIVDDILDKAFLFLIYIVLIICLMITIIDWLLVFPWRDNILQEYTAEFSPKYLVRWLMVFQKCIPISLILIVEVIQICIAWTIHRRTGQRFNYKMVHELGYVSHIVSDLDTLSGKQLKVDLMGDLTGFINLDNMDRRESSHFYLINRGSTVRSNIASTRGSNLGSNRGSNYPQLLHDRPASAAVRPNMDDQETARVALAICHTCGERRLGVQYTEEGAMVEAAAKLGYNVVKRDSRQIELSIQPEWVGQKTSRKFEILEMIPFSPKDNLTGMFVNEKSENGENIHRLFLKGSPISIRKILKNTETKVPDFSARGHRTVWFAEGRLLEDDWRALNEEVGDFNYRRSENSVKVKKLRDKFFPSSIRVIASVGIRMKLSKEAKEVIDHFQKAGIKLCLTTTAGPREARLGLDEVPGCEWSARVSTIQGDTITSTTSLLDKLYQEVTGKKTNLGTLALSGKSLRHILNMNSKDKLDKLRRLVTQFDIIIFSGATSNLKGDLVKLLSEKRNKSVCEKFCNFFHPAMSRKKVTLVVGDSADDIPMMEEADLNMFVTPADSDDDKVSSENTASYAKYIADFVAEDLVSFRDIVLIQGTWNSRSISQAIYLSLYKNILFVLIQFFYSFWFSYYWADVVEIFSHKINTYFNVYTVLPAFIAGIFNVSFSAGDILDNPRIYMDSAKKLENRRYHVTLWLSSALTHSILITVITCGFLDWDILSLSPTDNTTMSNCSEGMSWDENYRNDCWRTFNMMELSRPLIIIGVVVTFCIKTTFTEAIVTPRPTPCVKLGPKLFLSWEVLAFSTLTVLILIGCYCIDIIAFFLGESSEILFHPIFLAMILLTTTACLVTDLSFHCGQIIHWHTENNKRFKKIRQRRSVSNRRQETMTSVRINGTSGGTSSRESAV